MNLVIRWLTIALPFLVLGHTALLLINPRVAAGLQEVIDALERVIAVARTEAGNTTQPAKGLAEIEAFGKNVLSLLNALKNTVMSKEDLVKQANRIVDSLWDKAQVFQAKNGKDGVALADFKAQAIALRTEIINA